jgi:hypothetical protein
VVSFLNATIVLAIGETVEEVLDTGFLDKTATLSASTIGDDCLLQVWSVPSDSFSPIWAVSITIWLALGSRRK